MNNFLIYYNNGRLQAHDNMNGTLLHMIEVGVVKFIVDTKEGKAWVLGEEGIATKITVTQVNGLS